MNLSYPKPKRLVVSNITFRARKRDGACLYGLWHKDGCQGGLDGHHMIPVGAGGPDELWNIISLCRWHHTKVELLLIKPEELRRLMTVYHGFHYDEYGFLMEVR